LSEATFKLVKRVRAHKQPPMRLIGRKGSITAYAIGGK
jgi:hypothetical protein